MLPWIVVAVLAGVLALFIALPRFRAPAELPQMRLEVATPVTTSPGTLAISPDGRVLAFVASSDGVSRLWVRPLDATTARPLPGTEGASLPFWDPESRALGFFAEG